ncbi:MAG: ATP-binding protein [bacterium]
MEDAVIKTTRKTLHAKRKPRFFFSFRRVSVNYKMLLATVAIATVPVIFALCLLWYMLGVETTFLVLFLLSVGSIAVVALLSYRITRNLSQPLIKLTRTADMISRGQFDADLNFGKIVHCWEILSCDRNDCPAYNNLSGKCWFVDHTLCTGSQQGRFPQKIEECLHCEVYIHHTGDEIVQLADSFGNMIRRLKQSREESERIADFQNNLIQSSLDGIVATQADGAVIVYNDGAKTILKYEPCEVVGILKTQKFFLPEIWESLESDFTSEKFGGAGNLKFYDTEVVDKDGARIPVRISAAEMKNYGRIIGRVFILRDQTERLQMRRKMLQSERMAAVGEAIAGLSHSIKNVLGMIKGGEYMVDSGLVKDKQERVIQGWNTVKKGNRFIEDLVFKMLTLSRDKKPNYEEINPAEIVESIVEIMSKDAAEKKLNISTNLDPTLKSIMVDAICVRECLMNLVANAVDACEPGKGVIEIGTKACGETFKIYVKDNGRGIPEEEQGKIFQIFYSTKNDKGTGLGLAVTKKIMQEHNGNVTFTSTVGEGSSFTLEFPVLAIDSLNADNNNSGKTAVTK